MGDAGDNEIVFDDPHFARAVSLIDAGEAEALRRLLAEHPHLLTARVASDRGMTRGYFSRPTLLHFVANNPNRAQHMPTRILESTVAILDAGAEVDAATPHPGGGTTLALVASSEPAHRDGLARPLVELLVSRRADPARAIRAAMLHRYAATVQRLVELGAPPTLMSCAGLGEIDRLRALLARAADADELLQAGWAAALNGQAGAMRLLLDAGLDPNRRLPRPFDPVLLHEAAWHGHREVCETLLSAGADPSRRDTTYQATPAGWAREAGRADLAAFLESCPRIRTNTHE
jgi:hypothetical protein